MATAHSRTAARLMVSPAVILLFLWMIVPLGMTIYFSFLRYNLLTPDTSFAGFDNYYYFLTQAAFWDALRNTITLVVGVLLITVFGGIGLALPCPLGGPGGGPVALAHLSADDLSDDQLAAILKADDATDEA